LKNRIGTVPRGDLVIWDEAHHLAAAGWARVHQEWSESHHIGLTATPQRLDGKGLGTWFSALVQGPSTAWLIDNGWLSPYEMYAPYTPDMGGVDTKRGDWDRKQNSRRMDVPKITGCAIEHYLRLARGKRTIAFCCSIEHSKNVAAQFQRAGVMAIHLDGKAKDIDRLAAIEGFRAGQIDVLCVVDLVSEGLDVPELECVILLRPTQSLALYLQQVGRSLRYVLGKTALILDHAGNWKHGLPDEEREWTLDDRPRRSKKQEQEAGSSVRLCPECMRPSRPAPVCKFCGFVFPVASRKVKEVEGKLVKVAARRAQKYQRLKEQAAANTLDELVALGIHRGYKFPEKWAAHLFTSRLVKHK
ncbi:MAG: DEAD/DEAH box helicase family protein, partial [Gammaproteobacteria bacterium]|nr:DEAD/DEAH box helicase family protein [Gammaproteobacteria bacterium]